MRNPTLLLLAVAALAFLALFAGRYAECVEGPADQTCRFGHWRGGAGRVP